MLHYAMRQNENKSPKRPHYVRNTIPEPYQICMYNPEQFLYLQENEAEYSNTSPCNVLNFRYKLLQSLGKGSFGQVVKCLNLKDNSSVAIKLLNTSKSVTSIISEIDMLKYLNRNDTENLFVQYIEDFNAQGFHCVVFELLGENLYDYLKKQNFNGMEFEQVYLIMFQLCKAILKLEQLNVIHCDIKPENIAFVSNSHNLLIKLIDFGSSCWNGKTIYRYIQSRFYRAPEVILELGYDNLIDIWSVGCVLVELVTGKPIFPGNNELEQIWLFAQLLGPLPKYMAVNSPKFSSFFYWDNQNIVLKFTSKIMNQSSRPIASLIQTSPCVKNYLLLEPGSSLRASKVEGLIRLVEKMLVYDAKARIKPADFMFLQIFKTKSLLPAEISPLNYSMTPLIQPKTYQIPPYSIIPQPLNDQNYVLAPPLQTIINKQQVPGVTNHYMTYQQPYFVGYLYPMPYRPSYIPEISPSGFNPQTSDNFNHFIEKGGQCTCHECNMIRPTYDFYTSYRKDDNKLLY